MAGCAVVAPNGKLGAGGGVVNNAPNNPGSSGYGELTGSASIPLGCQFGLQADGALTNSSGGVWGGVAAHLFYRDPAKYLFGITGSYETGTGGGQVYRIGPEVELYAGKINLEAWAGIASVVGGPSDWFAAVDAAIYPNDNFRLSGGWRHSFGQDVAVGRAEVQLSDTKPVSLFAEGRVGQGGYSLIKAGVNVYFGADGTSLLARRRTADPQNRLFDLLAAKVNNTTTPPPGGSSTTCTQNSDCPSGLCGENGICSTPGVCGDGQVNQQSEQCDGGAECDSTCHYLPCDDNNRCTTDTRDSETHACVYAPVMSDACDAR